MKKITVYQVNDEAPQAHYLMFSSLDLVHKMGLKVTRDNYTIVWQGEVEDKGDADATLEGVFHLLNVGQKPEGYKGHSLSVSDIIEMDGKFYYTDDYGFEEIQFGSTTQPKAKKDVFVILIQYSGSGRTERKKFKTQAQADAYYEEKKNKSQLAFEPKEKWFTYISSWGRNVHVQKMY